MMTAHPAAASRPAVPTNHAQSAAAQGASAGLWIRVAANLRDRKVTWRLVEMMRASHPAVVALGAALPVMLLRTAAEGLLLNLWGKIAEHTTDGVITAIPAAQLEDWAGWDGTPGAFAAWVMASHFDREKGTVREWEEHAGALQAKRTSDAERQRRKRERDKQAREADEARDAGARGAVAAVAAVAGVVEVIDKTALALALTVAANKGMNDNPALAGAMPINAGRGDSIEAVTFFLEHGVPADAFPLIGRFVYTIAKQFEPTKRGDQIRSLSYFRESALGLWERHRSNEAARSAPDIEEVETAPKGRRGTRDRTQRAAVGAFAAADVAGLVDDESFGS